MSNEPIATALRDSKRDVSRFGDFFELVSERLLVFVTRRIYEAETAFDVTAESLARAFVKRRTFRGETDAQAIAWVQAIAMNEIAAVFRRRKVEMRAIERLGIEVPSLGDKDIARIEELAGTAELRAAVRDEMRRLSGEQREAIQLRVIEELPYEEVAAKLGISQEAARARVARGLRGMAQILRTGKQRALKEATSASTGDASAEGVTGI